jgi:hypothetical protein
MGPATYPVNTPSPLVRAQLQGIVSVLHNHLIDNRFRPALARYPLASFDYVTVYYVSLLRQRRSPGPDHGSCSSNVREANHVDLDHYQTKYVN